MEESDDFSGTGNLAPQSGVTSPGTPGDAGGYVAHIGSKCCDGNEMINYCRTRKKEMLDFCNTNHVVWECLEYSVLDLSLNSTSCHRICSW